jgi:Ni,Fe-hydrogenase maturation factor
MVDLARQGFFSGGDIRSGKVSTHDVSPKLLIEYLRSSIDAKIYLLGIRPGSNRFGQGLTKEVERSVNVLAEFLSVDNTGRL